MAINVVPLVKGKTSPPYVFPRFHYVSRLDDGHKATIELLPTDKQELVLSDGHVRGAKVVLTGKANAPDGAALTLTMVHTVIGDSPSVKLQSVKDLPVQDIDSRSWQDVFALRPVVIYAGLEDSGKVLRPLGGSVKGEDVSLTYRQTRGTAASWYQFASGITATTTGRITAGDVVEVEDESPTIDMRSLLAVRPAAPAPGPNGKTAAVLAAA